MLFHSLNCPHCLTPNAPLQLEGCYTIERTEVFKPASTQVVSPGTYATFWRCRRCYKPISMVLKTEHDLAQYLPRESNDINLDQLKYSDATYYPDLKSIEAPEYTPPGAARAYQQGMINFRQEQYEPCAIMMRKSLELAMKDLYPGGTGVLAKRIKDAANAGLLTKDMAEWAGEIKVIGNESVHGDMYTPMEDAEDVKDFTELFLTYAFTLPYRLFERREKRAAK